MNHFFSSWTPEMAWVLGLIFADGHIKPIRKTGNGMGRVCILTSIDLDLLLQVKALVGITVDPHKHRNRQIYNLQVGATLICEQLESYGIQQAKTQTMRFPDVPDDCLPHFVRGLWDGDGCIFTRARTRTQTKHYQRTNRTCTYTYTYHEVTLEYVCGSLPFIDTLQKHLLKSANVSSVLKTYNGGRYYRIHYYHRQSIRLLRWMYMASSPRTRLRRKYEKALPFIRENSDTVLPNRGSGL